MNTSRRNLYPFLIAAVSFILVIGAIFTALAESGFTPPQSGPATDTNIPLSTFTLQPETGPTGQGTFTPLLTGTPTHTKSIETPTTTQDLPLASPTTPESSLSPTETQTTVCTTPSGWVTYKVQSGDTLFSIAVRYQTDFRTLQAGNCMGSSTKIITGNLLWVPNNPTITPTKTTIPTVTKSVCYTLTLSHNGTGSTPTASPQKSTGCDTGMYIAGEKITLAAAPTSGWLVDGWTGTDDDTSTALKNSVTMPAANHMASVTYIAPTCYPLSLSFSGSGTALTATPTNSPGCGAGSYVEGATISLKAVPADGWEIAGWTGTINDNSTSSPNQVTMPASNHSASVTYQAICYTLTLSHTGDGLNPTASPLNSNGCSSGSYTFGENLTLTASPTGSGIVVGWTGTDADSSTSTTNTWTMQGNHAISVQYLP